MIEYTGWLLDLYPHPEEGIVLWLLCDDGQHRCFRQDFPVSFYAAGPSHRLRQLWIYLRDQPFNIQLAREERRDLFSGSKVVLSATANSPLKLPELFRFLPSQFPDLSFYDADVHISLRHAAAYGTFPLCRCHVVVDEQDTIQEIDVLDSKWDYDIEPAPLSILTIEPDVDPLHDIPKKINFQTKRNSMTLDLEKPSSGLAFLNYFFKQNDPDLIVTSHGDTWLMPTLLKLCEEENKSIPFNRDPNADIRYKKERSYFAYNQVIFRGQQFHLAGRMHLDVNNTVMYGDYGIEGVLEMARVTSLPIQTVARVSPGTGISAMQIVTALELEILIPLRKDQVEEAKTTSQLFHEDMGGTVYDPIIGLHEDVAEVDFFSMYPSIMARFNISPETVGTHKLTADLVEELEKITINDELGLIPRTLAPLLEKRFNLKTLISSLSRFDCRYKTYKTSTAAHKWLLVTCFGYLGYKNARFGRIEAHEAVTAYGREVLLRAKEAAEDMGFRVLHLYVDGMWVFRSGCNKAIDFQPLLSEIKSRTSLPIALDGVYKWMAFLSSRQNKRIAVPNRYFGVFQDGEIKTRGIETRRHDTPPFIRDTQMQILQILAKAENATELSNYLGEVRKIVLEKRNALRSGIIPPEQLIIHQTVSKNLNEYRVPGPAFSALEQMEEAGKSLRLGQSIRFIYTLGVSRASAWDAAIDFDSRMVNIPRYLSLLDRAIDTVLEPITGEDRSWLTLAKQLEFDLCY